MAIPFPSDVLPCPLIDISGAVGETFKKTNFDHGVRYRKTYCTTYIIRVKWVLNKDEMLAFRSWYWGDLDKGSLSFTADWDIEGDETEKEFHFYTPYKWARSYRRGLHYEITADIELKTKINEV